MIIDRAKLRFTICCCILAFLLHNSLALPVIETTRLTLALRPEPNHHRQQERQCLAAQANPDSIQPTPERIVQLLGPRQVENFVLPLLLKGRTDQQTRTVRDLSGEGAMMVLCRGKWPFPSRAVTELRAVYFMEWQNERRERHAKHVR